MGISQRNNPELVFLQQVDFQTEKMKLKDFLEAHIVNQTMAIETIRHTLKANANEDTGICYNIEDSDQLNEGILVNIDDKTNL